MGLERWDVCISSAGYLDVLYVIAPLSFLSVSWYAVFISMFLGGAGDVPCLVCRMEAGFFVSYSVLLSVSWHAAFSTSSLCCRNPLLVCGNVFRGGGDTPCLVYTEPRFSYINLFFLSEFWCAVNYVSFNSHGTKTVKERPIPLSATSW